MGGNRGRRLLEAFFGWLFEELRRSVLRRGCWIYFFGDVALGWFGSIVRGASFRRSWVGLAVLSMGVLKAGC